MQCLNILPDFEVVPLRAPLQQMEPPSPLTKIAIAHYQFETIHPFLDGNGRLGWLMIALYLASFGLLHKPVLYLSDYFERNKTEYADRLMSVRDANKMKDWLIFFYMVCVKQWRAPYRCLKTSWH